MAQQLMRRDEAPLVQEVNTGNKRSLVGKTAERMVVMMIGLMAEKRVS